MFLQCTHNGAVDTQSLQYSHDSMPLVSVVQDNAQGAKPSSRIHTIQDRRSLRKIYRNKNDIWQMDNRRTAARHENRTAYFLTFLALRTM